MNYDNSEELERWLDKTEADLEEIETELAGMTRDLEALEAELAGPSTLERAFPVGNELVPYNPDNVIGPNDWFDHDNEIEDYEVHDWTDGVEVEDWHAPTAELIRQLGFAPVPGESIRGNRTTVETWEPVEEVIPQWVRDLDKLKRPATTKKTVWPAWWTYPVAGFGWWAFAAGVQGEPLTPVMVASIGSMALITMLLFLAGMIR